MWVVKKGVKGDDPHFWCGVCVVCACVCCVHRHWLSDTGSHLALIHVLLSLLSPSPRPWCLPWCLSQALESGEPSVAAAIKASME